MKRSIPLAAGLIIAGLNPIASAAVDGAKLVHQDCMSCHGTEVYSRPDKRIKSLQKLEKQVHRCIRATGVNWDQAQVEAVVDYLNVHFYKFPQ